jgi:DNA-binding GntR family transcriptional regulator
MEHLDFSGLTPVARPSTSETVTSQIRSGIFDGTFRPGSQMREVRLAAQLGVSRGPLREALQRLIQEGLLEHRRHRGVFVVRLNREDVKDIYFIRETLELPAVLQLARNPSPEIMASLQELVESMSRADREGGRVRAVQLDAEFHQKIVDGAGSVRLTRMFETVQAETRMCLGALRPSYPDTYDVAGEHRALLQALRGADEGTLTRLWIEHLRAAATALSGGLEERDA